MALKFNSDGKFKILLLADTQDIDKPQKETLAIVDTMLKKQKPDLVVLLGDNIHGQWRTVTKEKTDKAVDNIASLIESYGVPFAFVFGNHDHEGLCNNQIGMSKNEAKEYLYNLFSRYSGCLAVPGEKMTGYCNYNLTIKSSVGDKDVFNLWFMDSNDYADEGGYGYVQPDQTRWYINKSEELKALNGGKPLPSVLFQHIPVPEVYNFVDEASLFSKGAFHGNSKLFHGKYFVNNSKVIQGGFKEGACCADVWHNQFETWKQQGDIIAAFFGHDHPNDYLGFYEGIGLCAVPAAGYHSYGWNHGARTLILDENDLTHFETELFTEEEILGRKVYPRYKAKHGYSEYINKFLPTLAGTFALATAATGAITYIIKEKRK